MSTATPTTALQAGILVAFFGLFFYQWGATNIEGFLNYPFWRDMGAKMAKDDYLKLYKDHGWKLLPLLVIPFLLYTVSTIALAIYAPAYIPHWLPLGILALQMVVTTSSAFVQVPLRVQLDRKGFDSAKFNRLITTDFWLRKIPSAAEAVLVLMVLTSVAMR